jgi:hypothetical protein
MTGRSLPSGCCPGCGALLRVCGRCRRLLPVDAFYACSSRADGLQWACVECQLAYRRERAAKRARRREAARQWRAANPGRHAATSRRYRAREVERRLAALEAAVAGEGGERS